MPNLLDILRRGNIFAPTPPPVIMDDPRTGGISGNADLSTRGIPPTVPPDIAPFEQSTEFADRYRDLLDRLPERNKPGIGRKIAASLLGLGEGGVERAQNVLYSPYNREMEDWLTEAKALEPALGYERSANTSGASAYNQYIDNLRQERELEVRRKNAETSAKRAAVYEYKTLNPNSVLKVDENGNLLGVNPQTEQANFIIGPGGKPVNTGDLSDQDRINMQLESSLTQIGARGEETRKTQEEAEKLRQANRINLENLREQGRRWRQEKGIETRETTESQTQAAQRVENNLQKMINEHPEWEKWVDVDPNNNQIKIKEVGETSGGLPFGIFGRTGEQLDSNTRDQMFNYLFGGGPQVTSRTTTNTGVTRGEAIDWLNNNGVENPNEAQINEAIKDLSQ